MHVRWLGSAFLMLVAAATTAHAETPPEKRLAGCEGLPAKAKVARYDAIGEDAIYVVGKAGDRYVAFPKEEDQPCTTYALAKSTATAKGSFATANTAVAVKPKRCAAGNCTVAVITSKDDQPQLALRTSNCDIGFELKAIKLFGDRDSLELVCRGSAGAGWTQQHLLLDPSEDTLVTLFKLNAGSYIAVSPAEKKAGGCSSCPTGSLRVEQAGDKPLIRVVDPATGTLHDGKGTVPARQLGYDAKKHTFTPTGAPDIATQVDAHAGCR